MRLTETGILGQYAKAARLPTGLPISLQESTGNKLSTTTHTLFFTPYRPWQIPLPLL